MAPKDPENTLAARWSKARNDVVFEYPERPDGRLLYYFFSVLKPQQFDPPRALLDELEARGYDLTTIRFSIKRKRA